MGKTALVAGSTGLIGKQLLTRLFESSYYDRVIAITRRQLETSHPKLLPIITGYPDLAQHADELVCDDVFCCLGTTIAKARSREKFYEVDFEYPVKLAEITKAQGARQYLLVSALGASTDASVYYNRVKGETEAAITNVRFDTLHILRPALLLGDRDETRPAEEAAKVFFRLFGILLPLKYKGIDAAAVASAMVSYAQHVDKGTFIHESNELQQFT